MIDTTGRRLNDPEILDMFAEDLALSEREDRDTGMLVGFALAVRRSVLEEVGLFDERFGLGTFEDTDLVLRIQEAGYRCRLANRAFIWHHGSRTLNRAIPDLHALMSGNEAVYVEKYRRWLELGYINYLPGLQGVNPPLVFNSDRHPDKVAREVAEARDIADIHLCMIVRNEERCLAALLESILPFVTGIHIVDTGSTDGTVEIAKRYTTSVKCIQWPDSFSIARNASLAMATGKNIWWTDADNIVPYTEGEKLVRAIAQWGPNIGGGVLRIQFVDGGPGAGTIVDHLAAFPNGRGIGFVRRCHEQCLDSARKAGEIVRLDVTILHANYDTSPAGQARKRDREWYLLKLDLEEMPDDTYTLFCIGMTHHHSDEHERAIEWLDRSIATAGPVDSTLRKSWVMKGVSLWRLDRLEEAERAFRWGLEQFPDDPELTSSWRSFVRRRVAFWRRSTSMRSCRRRSTTTSPASTSGFWGSSACTTSRA
jgi:glycosyltransferase involved in cell wall biosynthesis